MVTRVTRQKNRISRISRRHSVIIVIVRVGRGDRPGAEVASPDASPNDRFSDRPVEIREILSLAGEEGVFSFRWRRISSM